jgi:hypothetical protein
MKIGMDKTIVYNRKEEVFLFEEFQKRNLFFSEKTYGDFTERRFVIGFCGKIYPVICISWEEGCEPYIPKGCSYEVTTRHIGKYFYSQEDYLNFKKLFKELPDRIGTISRDICRYESIYDFDWSFLLKYFSEYKTPIFVIKKNYTEHRDEIIINCALYNFNFMKVKDTFSAFQDIQMYISGVLGVGQPELIQIGNKEMIQKKGFDKFSFRKRPEKVK